VVVDVNGDDRRSQAVAVADYVNVNVRS